MTALDYLAIGVFDRLGPVGRRGDARQVMIGAIRLSKIYVIFFTTHCSARGRNGRICAPGLSGGIRENDYVPSFFIARAVNGSNRRQRNSPLPFQSSGRSTQRFEKTYKSDKVA
jgi:hypothetical protein